MNTLEKTQPYFKNVGKIKFEGPDSDNPFAYRYYNGQQLVRGKTMEDHLRFAVSYWHSFCGDGSDPFGWGPRPMPWNEGNTAEERAKNKMDAAFEFISKLGLTYYCFHDVDIIDEGENILEFGKRLEFISDYALEKQAEHKVKVLWGTANLFSHPRYMNGAATNPDFNVVAHAGAQVRNALDTTIKLSGENYVFWGGREGYMSLLNTDMKREKEHLARFLHMAKDYARNNGFEGTFFIEPKPAEPTKHQYDYDASTVLGFLREFNLLDDFKLNIEVNHATLALHTFEHELQVSADANALGSIDANRGDYQNGWDTDQFPVDLYELTQAMLIILNAGGFQGGGINFDAKLRRNSTDLEDLFHAHIGGIDAFARALLIADKIATDSDYYPLLKSRYSTFDEGKGADFENGKLSLEDLAEITGDGSHLQQISGRQEYLENLINRYI
ncbi:xylose isomerase [Membranihabitans maritimus]|uniref:xylose isomerase n=1 Tax=Membranihabitans maritimus TaxID=2904244 RepID=UPI001F012D6C|nr:xylose isomerase [Membranihabitans maritimus]